MMSLFQCSKCKLDMIKENFNIHMNEHMNELELICKKKNLPKILHNFNFFFYLNTFLGKLHICSPT